MRIRLVEGIKDGDILAEEIMNDTKNVLIPAGTMLKKDYIPLIQSMGVDTLMIEDPYQKYEVPHTIIPEEHFVNYVAQVRELMEQHIYQSDDHSLQGFEVIANEMNKEVSSIKLGQVWDIKEHNSDLYVHTVMVTLLSLVMARQLKIDKKKRYNIALGCLLHDLGLRYITVPYANRNMLEIEDPTEVFEYKKHTILGYSALEGETWIPHMSLKLILEHHENMNGTGFPMRKRSKEIENCIVQVADAFDSAIGGVEQYRTSVREAITFIQQQAGKKYDPTVTNLLSNIVAKYPIGTEVKTNKDQKAVVIEQTTNVEKPVVMMTNITDTDISQRQTFNLSEKMDISILGVV